MSCFRLSNVSYRYGKVPVLHGIDLSLEAGEILGLFGHNGAGKTTTIKLVLGLMKPAAGSVSVLGGDAGKPETSQVIGYLPENVMFYPQLTGREILGHFSRLKGASSGQVPDLLKQVGLGGAIDQRVKTYSKGMRQRLGLAQALLGKPRLLMLDEPTVGLDPMATADLYRLLRRLRDEGTGIVLCSHVLPGVEPYIDRAAILTAGTLKATGDLASLRRQANMPVTLSLEPVSDKASLQSVIKREGIAAQTLPASNGRLHVNVHPGDKMAAIGKLLASGTVRDLGISQPTLEDLYVHFTGPSGLAQRGGT